MSFRQACVPTYLGHVSVVSTQYYLTFLGETAYAANERFHAHCAGWLPDPPGTGGARWLGHASIETTNRYAAIDLETKREALKRAGPLGASPPESVTAWRSDASVLEWLEAL